MSEAVLVRDSRDDDAPAIAEIYAHWVRHGTASFELTAPDAAEMARRRQAVLAAGHAYLVAELDEGIAGYCYASAFRPRPAYADTVEDTVYVAAWAHRRGVGRALLAALIQRCEAAGRRQMVGVIGDSASRGSIGLHEAMGFRRVGLLSDVGYKHGAWRDVVLMQRRLGIGAEAPPADAR
jgi:L-amino acid N-acyltransferase YncA